jgi:hypothetical protein
MHRVSPELHERRNVSRLAILLSDLALVIRVIFWLIDLMR